MLQQSQLHFCTKQIMPVMWSLTQCAAVKLSIVSRQYLFLPYTTQGRMSDRSSTQSFAVSRNLANPRNYFIEAKIYENISQ